MSIALIELIFKILRPAQLYLLLFSNFLRTLIYLSSKESLSLPPDND
jgi:hypothetical protein